MNSTMGHEMSRWWSWRLASRVGWLLVSLFGAVEVLASGAPGGADALRLWYDKPAQEWVKEALPLGNGRLGCLVFGGIEQERIPFNENSLWSGDGRTPGACERFGELVLDLEPSAQTSAPADYRRELSLDEAEARVSFRRGVVTHTRTVFVSQPEQVLVLRWTADRPGAVSGRLQLRGVHGETSRAEGDILEFAGTLANGLPYEARARVFTKGGTLEAGDGVVRLHGCDEVWVALAAATGYAMNPAKAYRGFAPEKWVDETLWLASRSGYEYLHLRHLAHHQCFFRQVRLDLGRSPADVRALPTDRRLEAYAAGGADPELEALIFQYGRYLLLSSSHRTGLPEKYTPKETFGWYPGAAQMPNLPAQAQGLWCDGNTAFAADAGYRADGPLQIAYWGAEPANLDKCHLPLLDLLSSQHEAWRKTAQAAPEFLGAPARGWAVRGVLGTMGGMSGEWLPVANAWLCRHLWEHYVHLDTANTKSAYTTRLAYPLLKEACEFWEGRLVAGPDGRLLAPGGSAGDQEIVWDLFNNVAEIAKAQKLDEAFDRKVGEWRDRLALPVPEKIGSERDLFGVYPGRRISREKTPELARAAAAALTALGETPAACRPWRCALWARLGEGENAYRQFRAMAGNLGPNLVGGTSTMRIDAIMGMTGALCELFLQSQSGTLELLPALPAAWPEGNLSGLKAPGGLQVDLAWTAGKVSAFKVAADTEKVGMNVNVKANGTVQTVKTVNGGGLLQFQGW